ncbi:MAG TPA: hypothetical protein VLI05_00800 [Candidatus Saccharimonadia bacterium]|nr:hypothetical protein [Candidatus Saccharimonadia bacterium]
MTMPTTQPGPAIGSLTQIAMAECLDALSRVGFTADDLIGLTSNPDLATHLLLTKRLDDARRAGDTVEVFTASQLGDHRVIDRGHSLCYEPWSNKPVNVRPGGEYASLSYPVTSQWQPFPGRSNLWLLAMPDGVAIRRQQQPAEKLTVWLVDGENFLDRRLRVQYTARTGRPRLEEYDPTVCGRWRQHAFSRRPEGFAVRDVHIKREDRSRLQVTYGHGRDPQECLEVQLSSKLVQVLPGLCVRQPVARGLPVWQSLVDPDAGEWGPEQTFSRSYDWHACSDGFQTRRRSVGSLYEFRLAAA